MDRKALKTAHNAKWEKRAKSNQVHRVKERVPGGESIQKSLSTMVENRKET